MNDNRTLPSGFGPGGSSPIMACFRPRTVHHVLMPATVAIAVPDSLLLHSKDLSSLEQRSRFLLPLKYFELDELTSGQAAEMCGMSRVEFIFAAGRLGVAVTDLSQEELAAEFT